MKTKTNKNEVKHELIETLANAPSDKGKAKTYGKCVARLVNALIFFGASPSTPRSADSAGLSSKEWALVFECCLPYYDYKFFMSALVPDDVA